MLLLLSRLVSICCFAAVVVWVGNFSFYGVVVVVVVITAAAVLFLAGHILYFNTVIVDVVAVFLIGHLRNSA